MAEVHRAMPPVKTTYRSIPLPRIEIRNTSSGKASAIQRRRDDLQQEHKVKEIISMGSGDADMPFTHR